MEVHNFNPGSVFGVPLTPFPPGMRWNTRRDMLHEVMTDLHRGWVQDYLLQQDASDDARVLSSPAQLSKSVSVTFKGCMDTTYQQSLTFEDMLSTAILVPAFKTDDVSAGLSVEHYFGAPLELIIERDRFVRYVRNDRTGAICSVGLEDERDTVQVWFYTMTTLSNSAHLQMKFRTADFKKAFAAGFVDFELLEKSMLTLAVGCSSLGPTPCTCHNSGCGECFAVPPPFMRYHGQEPSLVDYIEFGDFYSRSVFSEYNGGRLMKAMPVFAFTSRNFGAPDSVIEKMVSWGMADRLGRLKPVAPAVMQLFSENVAASGPIEEVSSFGVEISANDIDEVLFGDPCGAAVEPLSHMAPHIASVEDESGRIGNISLNLFDGLDSISEHLPSIAEPSIQVPYAQGPPVCKNANRGAVRIAPASSAAAASSAKVNVSTSLLDEMERKRVEKLEHRKIRKREAAFRSNFKRSEQRRIARLTREKETQSCLTTI